MKKEIEEIINGLFDDSYDKAIMMMLKKGYTMVEAEDAVQDTFERMTNKMQEGTDSDMNEAYFITSVKNAGIDVKRSVYDRDTVYGDDVEKYKTMEEVNLSSRNFFRSGDYSEPLDIELIMDIINNKIKPKHKEAILLVYFRGYTVHEAAVIFSINPNTLLSRLTHAYAAIRMFYNLMTTQTLDKKKPSDVQKQNIVKKANTRFKERELNKRHWGTDEHYNR